MSMLIISRKIFNTNKIDIKKIQNINYQQEKNSWLYFLNLKYRYDEYIIVFEKFKLQTVKTAKFSFSVKLRQNIKLTNIFWKLKI